MKNPNPIDRAWRLEKRRKELGSDDPSCFFCPESDVECLELDHPVTEDLDEKFKRPVCRNHHRKLELNRDLLRLTHNGRRGVQESQRDQLRRYILLLAEDQDSIAERLLQPGASIASVAAAIRAAAASLRRKASEVATLNHSLNDSVTASTEPTDALPAKKHT